MKPIDIDQLKDMKGSLQPVIINVLDETQFKREHIPGSVNVPVSDQNFLKNVEKQVRGKDAPVVVHCSGPDCQASHKAGRQLEEAGFQNVYHFKGGMEEWKEAGRSVEAGA